MLKIGNFSFWYFLKRGNNWLIFIFYLIGGGMFGGSNGNLDNSVMGAGGYDFSNSILASGSKPSKWLYYFLSTNNWFFI